MRNNKKNAIEFVLRIPQFQRDLSLLNSFLGNIDDDQIDGLLHFLKMTEMLFVEKSLSGDYSCVTGNFFNMQNQSSISLVIEDIQNGKYDVYL